jgi:Flp pilus assembly protein TadB
MEPLVQTTVGRVVLAGGIVFIGIGIFWMQKIVKVDA